MDPLTDLEARVLAFEAKLWRHRGAREEAIRKEFGLSPWQYQQLVFQVCAKPAALAAAPVLVNRVQRLRRRSSRT